MRVRDLIEMLQEFDPASEVRLAQQPRWPFEYSIGRVEQVDFEDEKETSVVYIAEGHQLGYLPGAAAEVLWQ